MGATPFGFLLNTALGPHEDEAWLAAFAEGLGADLVIFNARSWSEFLSRPQADRIVMRNGMGIDRSLPDYRELDPLMDK